MARATEITVSAGRTFNHPFESYSNLKPQVTVRATIEPGEDWEAVTKDLQSKAESLVEDHKRHMLKSLQDLEDMTRKQAEATSLARKIQECQERLDKLRGGNAPAIESDADAEDVTFGPDGSRGVDDRSGGGNRSGYGGGRY